METNKREIMEKFMRFQMLMHRLSSPRGMREGPRGRSQERALTQIALRDGISQRELMEKLGVQPSSMSELVSKLEDGGMIERRTSPEDRRQVNLFMSETGRRYLEHVNDREEYLLPFDALSDEELDSLDRVLQKLIDSAEKACANAGLSLHPPRPFPPAAHGTLPRGGEFGIPGRPEPPCPRRMPGDLIDRPRPHRLPNVFHRPDGEPVPPMRGIPVRGDEPSEKI
ncbi:MAG: MarR family transcriptional regulator [Clostridia bacterium]|nr:MarR family transcriptional regulator [Clostridia bacterium]